MLCGRFDALDGTQGPGHMLCDNRYFIIMDWSTRSMACDVNNLRDRTSCSRAGTWTDISPMSPNLISLMNVYRRINIHRDYLTLY